MPDETDKPKRKLSKKAQAAKDKAASERAAAQEAAGKPVLSDQALPKEVRRRQSAHLAPKDNVTSFPAKPEPEIHPERQVKPVARVRDSDPKLQAFYLNQDENEGHAEQLEDKSTPLTPLESEQHYRKHYGQAVPGREQFLAGVFRDDRPPRPRTEHQPKGAISRARPVDPNEPTTGFAPKRPDPFFQAVSGPPPATQYGDEGKKAHISGKGIGEFWDVFTQRVQEPPKPLVFARHKARGPGTPIRRTLPEPRQITPTEPTTAPEPATEPTTQPVANPPIAISLQQQTRAQGMMIPPMTLFGIGAVLIALNFLVQVNPANLKSLFLNAPKDALTNNKIGGILPAEAGVRIVGELVFLFVLAEISSFGLTANRIVAGLLGLFWLLWIVKNYNSVLGPNAVLGSVWRTLFNITQPGVGGNGNFTKTVKPS